MLKTHVGKIGFQISLGPGFVASFFRQTKVSAYMRKIVIWRCGLSVVKFEWHIWMDYYNFITHHKELP